MTCQRCESDRLLRVDGHSEDRASAYFKDQSREADYLPYIDDICGGDDFSITVCLECGQMQGTFPKEDPEL